MTTRELYIEAADFLETLIVETQNNIDSYRGDSVNVALDEITTDARGWILSASELFGGQDAERWAALYRAIERDGGIVLADVDGGQTVTTPAALASMLQMPRAEALAAANARTIVAVRGGVLAASYTDPDGATLWRARDTTGRVVVGGAASMAEALDVGNRKTGGN